MVYLSKKKMYDDKELEWEELDANGCSLLLQHFTPELTAEPKNINSSHVAEYKRSVLMLLKMIRDIAHNVNQRKQSIMLTVENYSELYLKYQESMQSTNNFYKVFNATIDTINAHGGKAGSHPQVYKNHLVAIKDKDRITVKSLAAMDADGFLALKQKMEDTAMASSCEEYLACLFLLVLDDV